MSFLFSDSLTSFRNKNLTKVLFIGFCSFFSSNYSYSQTQKVTLPEALRLAKQNSLEFKIAQNTAQSSFWNYQSFKSSFLPKLSLNGTMPEYFHSINRITLPNGQYDFVAQDVATSTLNLALSQNVGLTGGRISMSSSLDRIDNFGSLNKTLYTSVPLSLSYFQNSLFYNEYRWQKKIQPLRFQESQKDYIERLEAISSSTVDKFFDVLQADVQLKLDQQNFKNVDTLVKNTTARYEIGTVQLNDLLQAKVSLLNAKKAMANAQLQLEVARQDFVKYLNLDRVSKIELIIPEDTHNFVIDEETALEHAKSNRKSIIEFQRRRLEAEQSLARSKSETGPEISIRSNIGFSQRGNNLNQAYNQLLNNQTFVLGISIPLVDWGVNKSNRKRAEASLELEKNNISQQMLSIEQEIVLQVMKWGMLKDQLEIAKEARELANKRYEIARQKFALGTLNFTDFNNAQLDKDRAVIDYINNLRNYWSLYYLIRRLTHYDFENNRLIELEDQAR